MWVAPSPPAFYPLAHHRIGSLRPSDDDSSTIAVRAPRLMLVFISGAFGLSGGPNGGSWKEWKEFRARLAGTTKGTGSSANQAA